MHFESLGIDRVTWSSTKKGAIKAVYGGGKFEFQTPRCIARLEAVHKFPGAVALSIDERSFREDGFVRFLRNIETAASESLRLDPRDASRPFRRVVAFSNAEMFDVDGGHVEAPETHEGWYDVAALVQLDGAWIGAGRWGLKFKVKQIKLYGKSRPFEAPAAKFQFLEEPGGGFGGSQFVDDL